MLHGRLSPLKLMLSLVRGLVILQSNMVILQGIVVDHLESTMLKDLEEIQATNMLLSIASFLILPKFRYSFFVQIN